MKSELRNVVDYLEEKLSDPIPRYIFKKEILHENVEELKETVRDSKWYKQLKAEQWENGSWGRFHTQDTKMANKQKFVTTESALRRAKELSLEKEDEIVHNAIQLLVRYINDEEDWLDVEEHHYGFRTALKAMMAANISLFEPRHPLVQIRKKVCAQNIAKAFANDSLDEDVWENENRKSDDILLRSYMLHVIWLLQNNDFLDMETEQKYLDYIWNREEGIYYCTSFPLYKPQTLESKQFLYWLSGLESVCDFTLFPEYINREIYGHLLGEINKLMNGDTMLPDMKPIFGHYAESYRDREMKKSDLILRMMRILVK